MVEKVKVGENIYEDDSDIVAKLNESFSKLFTRETEFNESLLHEVKYIYARCRNLKERH